MEASTKSDQAAIDAARTQLDYCKIRSPIDGRTGTRLVDVGNIVHASSTTSIVTIKQIHPIWVEFSLPAQNLAEVRAGMKAAELPVVALDRSGNPLASGKLTVVDNQVNVATGTVRFKAVFQNIDETLWPGEFVGIRLQLDLRRNVVTIPLTAVLRGPEETYAFVIGHDRVVRKQPITVGFANTAIAIIDSGLEPGDQVVIDGQYRIQSGTPVTIVPDATRIMN